MLEWASPMSTPGQQVSPLSGCRTRLGVQGCLRAALSTVEAIARGCHYPSLILALPQTQGHGPAYGGRDGAGKTGSQTTFLRVIGFLVPPAGPPPLSVLCFVFMFSIAKKDNLKTTGHRIFSAVPTTDRSKSFCFYYRPCRTKKGNMTSLWLRP